MADHEKIFINFRRNDTGGWASLLNDRLSTLYDNEVFFDEKIERGKPYPKRLIEAVENCKLFLAVIGPDWDSAKHINELKKQDDWVRREIEIALKLKRTFIPIFINRSVTNKSESIKSIFGIDIFEYQGCVFSRNTVSWDADIRSLSNDILKHTGLKPKQDNSWGIDPKTYVKHVCELNRYNQFHDLEYQVKNGKALFAVSGRNDIEVEHFAKRFLLSIDQEAEPITLIWDDFCEIKDKDPIKQYTRRENDVYKKVAEKLALTIEDKNTAIVKQLIQQRLNTNKSAFLCIREGVSAKNQNGGDVADWWKIWASLLGTQQKRNTIVLLFTIPGWRGSLPIFFQGKPDIDLIQLKPFGKITIKHMKNWRREKKIVLPKINWDKKVFKLFRFGRSRPYEYVNEHLEQVLITAEENHHAN